MRKIAAQDLIDNDHGFTVIDTRDRYPRRQLEEIRLTFQPRLVAALLFIAL